MSDAPRAMGVHAAKPRNRVAGRVLRDGGKDENGKVVSNPSIGYGALRKTYADGNTREFYQVGISANSAGLTVYLMGVTDRAYLKATYGPMIGKAEITGYCIKFRALKNVDLKVLEQAIHDGMQRTRA